ncbi:Maf family nucleotide pyrophosphatase [Labrys wisconsinensis]|uniref:dTTP/UTP pyrophosphatase n=1 Tax=Labrys wisconsinensis TaxID=425677 RepID=A0ABU0JEB5_9HYPH|nr:Maf family nucleotide pyrophosphatase [Labrys wisconsinensis]MDQ0472613.1 septum formation protein [Labrys wisconsinensis]
MPDRPKLVLASASPRRLALLEQAGCAPDALLPSDLDETPKRGEAARSLVQRLARDKVQAALTTLATRPDLAGAYVLAADTAVSCTGRLLPKAERVEEADACLRLLSGRTHRVMTGVAVAAPGGAVRTRMVETRVRFKHLSRDELDNYLGSGEWKGKAGGYAIQGLAGVFAIKLVGSYTNVVGLPLYETVALLEGEGFPVRATWLDER